MVVEPTKYSAVVAGRVPTGIIGDVRAAGNVFVRHARAGHEVIEAAVFVAQFPQVSGRSTSAVLRRQDEEMERGVVAQ